MNGAAEDASAAFSKGNYGEVAGALVGGAATAIPTSIVDFGEALGGGIIPGVKGFWKGLTRGQDPSSANPAAAPVPVPAPGVNQAAAASPPAAVQTDAQRGGGNVPPVAQGNPASTQAPAGGVVRVDRPGQSPLFTNLPVDGESNTALMARGFQPSAQNQAAAQALSDRSSAEVSGINAKAQYDAEVAAAQQANQANLAVSRQIERGMQRDALIKQAGQTNSRSRAAALLQAASSMDSVDQRGAEVAGSQAMEGKRLDQAAAQFGFNSKLAREKQALETRKADAEIGGVNADTQVKGFTARAAERLAKLQEQYMTAKPEDQPVLAKQIQALAGKSDKPQMHVVNRPDTVGPDGMTKLGGGQALVVQNADGSFSEMPMGGGRPSDINTDPRAIAIRDNKDLSDSEKRKQLQFIGYK